MKCSVCHNVLDFPESVLKQLKLCPFCNSSLEVEDFSLKKMIEQNGLEIFDDKFEEKLKDNLKSLTENERLVIQLLLSIDFPKKLYRASGESENAKEKIISEAIDELESRYSIPFYRAEEKISDFLRLCNMVPENYIKRDITYDEPFVDERDGNVYKTVNLNGRVWMAENFRYKSPDSISSYDSSKESTYGRFYTWADALDLCPSGWHIPTDDDLKALIDCVGKKQCSRKLKSKSWNGFDSKGFNMLYSGYCFYDDNRKLHYSNSLENDNQEESNIWGRHYYLNVTSQTRLVEVESKHKSYGAFSVRYVKGRDIEGEQEDEKREYEMRKLREEFEEEKRKLDRELKAAKGECFITTAVCEELNKPDDCYELQTLRNFRDNWLKKQAYGEALINEYYAIAPEIVKKINKKSNRTSVYRNINSAYIQKCICLIENGKMNECLECYKNMVDFLKKVN